MFADRLQKHVAEILGLARADAFHLQQRVNGPRAQTGHFAERGSGKNDVRRDASRSRLKPGTLVSFFSSSSPREVSFKTGYASSVCTSRPSAVSCSM